MFWSSENLKKDKIEIWFKIIEFYHFVADYGILLLGILRYNVFITKIGTCTFGSRAILSVPDCCNEVFPDPHGTNYTWLACIHTVRGMFIEQIGHGLHIVDW